MKFIIISLCLLFSSFGFANTKITTWTCINSHLSNDPDREGVLQVNEKLILTLTNMGWFKHELKLTSASNKTKYIVAYKQYNEFLSALLEDFTVDLSTGKSNTLYIESDHDLNHSSEKGPVTSMAFFFDRNTEISSGHDGIMTLDTRFTFDANTHTDILNCVRSE